MTTEDIDAMTEQLVRRIAGAGMPYLREALPMPLYPPYSRILNSFVTSLVSLFLAEEPLFVPSEAFLLRAIIVDLAAVKRAVAAAQLNVNPRTGRGLAKIQKSIEKIDEALEELSRSIPAEERSSKAYFRPRPCDTKSGYGPVEVK